MDSAFLHRGGENLALLTFLSSHDPGGLHTMNQEESWTITLLVPSLTYPPRITLTTHLRSHHDADDAQPFPKTQIHREAVFITARVAACGSMCPFKGDGVGAHPGPFFFLSQSLFITAPSHRQQNKRMPLRS